MLTLQDSRWNGSTRRDFLKVGTLAGSGLSLSHLLQRRAEAAEKGQSTRRTSVVWLWLGGGPTHIETFDPKMTAPREFRSAVGAIKTSVPGIEIGGLLPNMAKSAQRMAFVRSFAHENSGHGGGTHYVMTGSNHVAADAGQPPIKPSIGSTVARMRGSNNPSSGMPTYVRLSGIYADGPEFLGSVHAPFDVGGEAQRNMQAAMDLSRVGDRRELLHSLDRVDRRIEHNGQLKGMDQFEKQAFGLIFGRAKQAFDLTREDPRVRAKYTACGHGLGDNLLLARRLCEAGCGFVTMNYSNSYQGWDMHSNIVPQMRQACPPLDRAVATFLEDLAQRGMSDDVLLVITGEFGRTPRINGGAGRDHWGPLCTLALAGGGLKMGQVVGESTSNAETPKSTPIKPGDLMATIYHVLGIDQQSQVVDKSGRPVYLIAPDSTPIRELI